MLKKVISELKEIKESKDFKESKDNIFLNSILFQEKPYFNFYNPKNKEFITFHKSEKIIKEESKPFKETENLEELKLDNIKNSSEEILEKVKELVKEKYKNTEKKSIIILQQRDIPVWSITIITHELKIISFIINANTSEVLEDQIQDILKFNQ